MSKKIYGFSKRNWKCFFVGFVLAWVCAGGCCAAFAGVPVKFTVETSRADVQEVQCYHGETLDFDVTFKNYGKDLVFDPSVEAQIFWQTNGMSAFYWRTNNVNVVSNRMTATFLPEMDPGANTVFGFIGIPGDIYRASFVLRLKQSPGVKVREMEWPYRELNFAQIEVKNAPYYTKSEADELLIDEVKNATNKLYEVLHHEVETATPGDYQTVSNNAMNAVQKSQRINNKPLAGDITIGPSDLGMYSNTEIDNKLNLKVGWNNNDTTRKRVEIGSANSINGNTKYLAVVGESNTIGGGDDQLVVGMNNVSSGADSGLIVGRDNSATIGSECSVILGSNNKIDSFGSSKSMVFGSQNHSRTQYGYVFGYTSWVTAMYGMAMGYGAWAYDKAAFAWNGDTTVMEAWKSHGVGTFNVNPVGGTSGFYIGNQNMTQLLASAKPSDYDAVKAKANSAMQPANTYNKTETDALIAANKPEYEDIPSNVVWRIEAEGGRFFFKPVRPINMED